MKDSLRIKRAIIILLKFSFLLTETLIFSYLWFSYYMDMMPVRYYRRGNLAVVSVYLFLTVLTVRAMGGLKVGHHRTWDLLYSQIMSSFMSNGAMYIIILLIHGGWALFRDLTPVFDGFFPMAIAFLCDNFLFIIWANLSRLVYIRLFPPHRMLFIYSSRMKLSSEGLIETLGQRNDRYFIEEKISIDGGMDRVFERMDKFSSCVIGDIPSHERNLLLKYGFRKNIRMYSVPKLSDIMIRSASTIDLFDTPIYLFRNEGISLTESFIKRIMDIVLSLIALIPCSLLFLVIAVMIKLYDGGPVFYTQKRLTKDGRIFDIIKFRSMVVDSEKRGARLAGEKDNRITPVGKVIRRLHFDELPQLLNILKGDMSLVGPRPERPDIAKIYEGEIKEFPFRLKVKAGLTGYAQVYGNYSTRPQDKLKLDLTYIENYSLWLDIKLMILTVKILFMKEKSEGLKEGKKTAL